MTEAKQVSLVAIVLSVSMDIASIALRRAASLSVTTTKVVNQRWLQLTQTDRGTQVLSPTFTSSMQILPTIFLLKSLLGRLVCSCALVHLLMRPWMQLARNHIIVLVLLD
jgi:hypothetical protein